MANNSNAAPDGGVDVFGTAFDRGRDYAVHDGIAKPDGTLVIFAGEKLRPYEFAPIDRPLPAYVQLREEVVEPASFIDYIVSYKSSSAICRASLGKNRIEAVLDFHGRAREGDADAARPNHAAFTVSLLCPFDPDYAKWRTVFAQAAADKGLDQRDLAEFIEDMIYTIGEPPAADLLEAIADLKIDRQVRFKSARNERNGNISFAYEETDSDGGKPSAGQVQLPDTLEVIVPIFAGGNPQRLPVRVRYRLDKGVVTFLLSVAGLDKIERDAFRSIGEEVRSKTDTPVYYVA